MPSFALLLNTGSSPIQVSVNRGGEFTIPATGPNTNWQPQSSSSNPVTYNPGMPAPNQFGMGANYVTLVVNGNPTNLMVSVPQSQQILSLQLYLFSGRDGISWVLLNDGAYLANGAAQRD